MTLTIAIEGQGVLTNAETKTGWSVEGSASAEQDEDDVVLQGNQAVSTKCSGNKNGWLQYYYGATGLDFTSGGNQEGQLVYIWWNCTTIGALDTMANSGIAIRISQYAATNWRQWTLGGNDAFLNNYTGGWQCAVIDPLLPGEEDGTFDPSDVRYFGMYINTLGLVKAENLIIDTIAVGKGLRITGAGATDGWQDVVDYCNDYTNRAWGMMQEEQGIYYVYGNLYLGQSTQTADTELEDTGRIFRFGDYYFHNGIEEVPAITAGKHGLIIEDNPSYGTKFVDGVVVGSDAGRAGSTFLGASGSSADVTVDLYGGNSGSSQTELYGTQFRDMDGGISWGNDADHLCYSVVFQNSAQFDPVGAVKIRNCLFTGYAYDTDAALLWNANIDIQDCDFVANTDTVNDPHAIEHPVYGEYDYTNMEFSGNDYDIYFTDTSGSLIINNLGTSNADTYESTSGSVFIVNQKSYELQNLVVGSEIRAYVGTNPLTAVEIDGVESSGSIFSFNHQEGGNEGYIVVHSVGYVPITIELTYPNVDTAYPISQRVDYSYDNP